MKTTMKSSTGYNARSNNGKNASSPRGFKAESPRGIKLIHTKTIYSGTFEVPEELDETRQRPYMYVSMRVRHADAGVRASHVGVVMNKFLYEHRTSEHVRDSYSYFTRWATKEFGNVNTCKLTIWDLDNYMSGRCQPKMDKLTLINQAFKKIEPGFSELDTTGWTTMGDANFFRA